MKGSLGDKIRLEHIKECISEISSALERHTFETFNNDHVLRIAVVKWLEIIGEASKHISEETKTKYKEVEWYKMTGLRNIVVHEYFGIDYKIIWNTATIYLKTLEEELGKITID
jgi:uncharacterized protein with HEPN domain